MRGSSMEQRRIGHEIKTLSNLLKRAISSSCEAENEDGITGMQSMILGYLDRHADREVYQRDIERDFKIRRSTVTGILQLMEKDGLIFRQSVKSDGRLKQIGMTEKAMEINSHIKQKLDEVDQKVICDFSEEELAVLYSMIDRMKKNLETN